MSKIYQQSKDCAIGQLLEYFPLLKSTSVEAKAEYMTIIPKLLAHSVRNMSNIEESRQLLSFALIHPSLSSDERRRLGKWLVHLDEQRHAEVQLPAQIPNDDVQQALADAQAHFMQSGVSMAQAIDRACATPMSQSSMSCGGQAVPVGRAITSSAACCGNKHTSCIGMNCVAMFVIGLTCIFQNMLLQCC